MCTPVFVGALFTVYKFWYQPKCLTTEGCTKKNMNSYINIHNVGVLLRDRAVYCTHTHMHMHRHTHTQLQAHMNAHSGVFSRHEREETFTIC